MFQHRGLEGFWAALGHPLAPRRLLAGSWTFLGQLLLGRFLRSIAPLERLLGRPGRQVGPSWRHMAPKPGGRNPPKSFKNRCQDVFHLGFLFLIICSCRRLGVLVQPGNRSVRSCVRACERSCVCPRDDVVSVAGRFLGKSPPGRHGGACPSPSLVSPCLLVASRRF